MWWHATHHSYSRWRTERWYMEYASVFLCQYIHQLQTFKNSPFLAHPVYTYINIYMPYLHYNKDKNTIWIVNIIAQLINQTKAIYEWQVPWLLCLLWPVCCHLMIPHPHQHLFLYYQHLYRWIFPLEAYRYDGLEQLFHYTQVHS